MLAGDSVEPIAAGSIPDSTIFVDGAVAEDGTIWAATRAGALRIHGNRVDRIDEANGLLSDLLNRVMIDREGDVWFGTERGASKHVPGPFRAYTEREGLPSPFVRALQLDGKGRLWMGTRNGVAVRNGERFTPIPLPKVPDIRVYSLARDSDNGMLIGTRRGLLWYSNGHIREYHEKTDNLPGEVIFSLLPDGKGGVWIGTDRGLARWERGVVTAMNRHEREKLSTISLALDRRGRLWMGHSAGGVTIVDGDSVRTITAAQGGSDQTIWSMSEDAQGRMWVATNGDGALRVDGDQVRRFTTKDGLASDFIWQTLTDSHGDTWLYGNLGLDRFSGTTLSHYGLGSGLIELEGAANASYEDSEHNLWFGTGSGVVRFTPGLDVAPTMAPPVYVEDITRDGKLVPVQEGGAEARLKRGTVQIHFASPSFRNESAIRFRYRLVGEREEWSAPTRERSITYAGLGPGSYRFQVVATNGAVQSALPATIAFAIIPAFWQTWWFRLIAIVLLIALTVAVPVLRARALEKERRRLEALVARHTRDLADKNARLEQSNRDLEHFAYVASHDLQEPLRKIQAFSDRVVKAYAPKLDDQGRDYLSRMSGAAARMQRLIDDLLSLSRITTKANRMETIALDELANDVLTDLEFRLHSTHGRVDFEALPRITGDPVQLRQIFLNLIGNALKFHRPGEAPVVRVSVAYPDADTVEIRFDDNGIGFEKKDAERVFLPFQRLHGRTEFEGTGIGLTICQKIAERHGGTIRAESVPGKGSRFIVTLPIHGPVGERHAA
jgi:signal transduction histidine kinase/streptogramin lyase